jgi:anti-sigma regulatory factor (Ser/Thr protein kinase)
VDDVNRLTLSSTPMSAPRRPKPPSPSVALGSGSGSVHRRHGPNAAVHTGESALPRSGQDTASWPLPASSAAVRPARRLAGEQLDHWGFGHHRDTAELLVSELVTNAICHGNGDIRLTVRLDEGTLRFEVHDEAAESVPHMRPAGDNDEGGRGLHLVGMLSSRWGATRTTTGKTVWFELQTNRPPRENDPDT